MFFGIYLVAVTLLSFTLTNWVRHWSIRQYIVDDPKSDPKRKKQIQPVPLLGNVGFTLAAIFSILVLYGIGWYVINVDTSLSLFSQDLQRFTQNLAVNSDPGFLKELLYRDMNGSLQQLIYALSQFVLEGRRLFWIGVSLLVLTIGGFLDDKYHFSARWQVLFITAYIVIAIFGGELIITNFSYPFNQVLPESYWFRALFSFAWIGFCVAATKFLDGLDGLVSIVGLAGFLLVAAISFSLPIAQPVPAILALVWAASIVGFLPFNFPNAKMYLGEGGSEIIGFLLGVFSLWSGAKVATVSMGIGIFILDWLLVMIMRAKDKRNPITSSDRFHWHHRLFDLGMTKIQVLAITSIFLVGFATLGLNSSTSAKPWLIIAEILVLTALFGLTSTINHYRQVKKSKSPSPVTILPDPGI